MAVPGDRSCRPVMPCGAGTWGDIPIDASTIHVDGSYAGGGSDGSIDKPWTTISDAVAAAPSGGLVAVAAGSYAESVTLTKTIQLWGVCPERVELAGTASGFGALFFRSGSSGSEVRGVAVTGDAGAGIVISGAENILLEQVWVHDALGRGVNIEDTLGATSATLRTVLIEGSHALGVLVGGASATLVNVVVRDTLPRASDQDFGRGIEILDASPGPVTITGSVVERNHDAGIAIAGSQATVEGVVVRDTLPNASNERAGIGIGIKSSAETRAPSFALVRSSLLDHNHEAGAYLIESQGTFEGVVVRRTQPRASDQQYGWGMGIQGDPAAGAPATALVRSSLVEDCHDVGLLVAASDATLEGLVVRRTLPQASDAFFGWGVLIQVEPSGSAPAKAIVRGSFVDQSVETGLGVMGADATVDATIVRATATRAADGAFGDGVTVTSVGFGDVVVPASATLTHMLVEQHARAGISNFGASVSLGASDSVCNTIHLNGEIFLTPYTFQNLGGNRCGCPEAILDACAVQTSGLVPPDPP